MTPMKGRRKSFLIRSKLDVYPSAAYSQLHESFWTVLRRRFQFSPNLFELGLWEWRPSNLELIGMLHKFTKGHLVLSEAVAHHQDDEASVGFVLEEFLDKIVGVKLSITAHCLHVRAELPVFAFKIGIGRLGHESIVHSQEVAGDWFSGSCIAMILGILRAYNGHVAGVKGGCSRSLVVSRGHTKTPVKRGKKSINSSATSVSRAHRAARGLSCSHQIVSATTRCRVFLLSPQETFLGAKIVPSAISDVPDSKTPKDPNPAWPS